MYRQTSYLPIIFQVGKNNIGQIDTIISSKNLLFKKIIVLSGETFSNEIAKKINLEGIHSRQIVFDNSIEEVSRLSEIIESNKNDLIISVGGGKVLDVAKRISLSKRINHICIPTIISNDGLISPISVLKDENGITHSMAASMPTGVIIDMDIIGNSPYQYIQAAAGDILSNISATNDWLYANEVGGDNLNDIGFQMSRMAAHALLNFDNIKLNSKHFLKMIIQGQVNSGIAMALTGTSRPCSGSEHLLSHSVDYLFKEKDRKLHGYQVGVLSLFCLYLQNKLDKIHLQYSVNIGLNCNVISLLQNEVSTLKEIFYTSRNMRPGRITVLDKYTDSQLINKLDDYNSYINNFNVK